jgi:6-pyruvoyl-tetrahydropterin synthase
MIEFGSVKYAFRNYLDTTYDHHLLLNIDDPWAAPIDVATKGHVHQEFLPGLVTTVGDPTTENIAAWVAEWAVLNYACDVTVKVQETHVNGVLVTRAYDRLNEAAHAEGV